ncbi:MAG: TIGR00725 family protein [Nitrospiria bacterium]
MAKRKPIIGVIGSSKCGPQLARMAEEVGRRIAEGGGILVCGGLGGVMQAAAMGAKQAGGQTIGILPDDKAETANPYIDFPISTGMGYARNVIIVKTADVLIAVEGKYGTLSEVAYALIFDKPLISLGSWEVDPKVLRAKDPQEAVEMAFRALGV